MAYESLRIELRPPEGVDTLLYQNDSNSSVSSATVFCVTTNQNNDRVNVALVSKGNVLSSSSYIAYHSTLYFGESIYLQQIALGPLDSVYVASENGSSNFVIVGQRQS
jgi:hypothetical protein